MSKCGQMDVNEYLKYRLENCAKYELTDADKHLLDSAGMEEFIFKKLTSKKFRKWSLSDNDTKMIRQAVHIAVEKQMPVQITFPFGAYKLWSMPDSPEAGWAEFFTLIYYSQYLSSTIAGYEPGVELHFVSDDVIVERANNVAISDTQQYGESFKTLLQFFYSHLPKNLKIDFLRVADFYEDKNEMWDEFEKLLKLEIDKYEAWPEEDRIRRLTTSALNIQWKGVEDWSVLSESEKEERIRMSAITVQAYHALSKRRAFSRGEDKIIIFATPIKQGAVPIGTTKHSVTKFWTGHGVLAKDEGTFAEYILSPKQWEEIKNQPHETIKSDLIPLRNFKEILVYPEKFTFSLR